MRIKTSVSLIAVVLWILVLAGCSSYSSTPNTQASSTASSASQLSVNIAGFAFSPQTLTVAKGTTVTWTNNDSTTHTVTSDSAVWDSGNLSPGKTFSYTFNQAGTFAYHCIIHPSMTASVVVQ